MSTERRTDMGDWVLVETGEPTVDSPTVWYSRAQEWKAGTSQANQDTIRQQAAAALAANRTFITATKPSTAAAQASQAYDQAVKLSRQHNGIIRLLLGLLDGVD